MITRGKYSRCDIDIKGHVVAITSIKAITTVCHGYCPHHKNEMLKIYNVEDLIV